MDFGVPINPSQVGGQSWVEMLQGAISGAQHPALRTGSVPYELVIPTFMPDRIAVVSIRGREVVNELFEYGVEVVSPFPPEIIQPAIFGVNASLVMHTPWHDARMVQGIIVGLSCLGIADRGLGKGLFQYEMTIAPPMWLWTQRERNRVFQNQTVIELAKSMLKADKIHHRFDLKEEEYPTRALYYQREETDFDFFKRILADAGIYFVFNHAVHDDTTGGVMSDVATGGMALGVTGGAMSPFAKAAGDRISSAGGTIEEVMKGVTILVLGEDDDGVVPLHDFSAVTELGDQAVKKGIDAASDAMGLNAGDKLKGAAGLDASDPIAFDDGYGSPGDELLFSVELRRIVRPKSTWMLERDRTSPQSWAHIQRNDPTDAQMDLDLHLRMTTQGIGVDGGAKIKMDVDAPWIDAKTLEKELIQRNAIWGKYPSESRPKKKDKGGIADKHEHLTHPLEQLRRDAQTATVTTSCRRLGAGYRFNVSQHPSAAFNIELTVLSLTVDAVDPEMLELDPKDPRTQRPFVATLQCAPADDYAPRPPLPVRRKYPMELATVIRWQESMDMVTESRNEVYVRLDWDVDRNDDNKNWFARGNDKPYPLSSTEERHRVLCVPIVQPWAGNGYGLQLVPREGMQVLIGFIDSQGDRPVLLGCLHTDRNPPPWGPGYDAKRVGFRTQSAWPNGMMADRAKADETVPPDGWSEISISDAESEERVYVHAAKDLAVDVVADHIEDVGGRASLSVHGAADTTIAGVATYTVAGDASLAAKSNAQFRVSHDFAMQIEGDQTRIVDGDDTERVTGDASSTVLGDVDITHAANHRGFFKGDFVERHAGHRVVIVGQSKNERSASLHVEGASSAYASGTTDIVADEGLTIRCGDSHIIIKKDAITIQSPTIALVATSMELTATDKLSAGSKQIEVSGSDSVKVASKKTALSGDSSSIVLDSNATIQGSAVKLGSGSGDAAKKKDQQKAKVTKIKLVDQDGKPLGGQMAILRKGGEGGPERVVVLDKDGIAEVEGDDSYDVRFPELPGAKAT